MQESGSIKSASPAKPFYILNTIAERILRTHPETSQDPINMGAVGVLAPTVFEKVGASTHAFWLILSQIHQIS